MSHYHFIGIGGVSGRGDTCGRVVDVVLREGRGGLAVYVIEVEFVVRVGIRAGDGRDGGVPDDLRVILVQGIVIIGACALNVYTTRKATGVGGAKKKKKIKESVNA